MRIRLAVSNVCTRVGRSCDGSNVGTVLASNLRSGFLHEHRRLQSEIESAAEDAFLELRNARQQELYPSTCVVEMDEAYRPIDSYLRNYACQRGMRERGVKDGAARVPIH